MPTNLRGDTVMYWYIEDPNLTFAPRYGCYDYVNYSRNNNFLHLYAAWSNNIDYNITISSDIEGTDEKSYNLPEGVKGWQNDACPVIINTPPTPEPMAEHYN